MFLSTFLYCILEELIRIQEQSKQKTPATPKTKGHSVSAAKTCCNSSSVDACGFWTKDWK